jgi:1,4-alpha-glucan branching enzyme
MPLIPVHFEYLTGLRQPLLVGARLTGNWDGLGRLSQTWSETPMTAFTAEDGCPAFRATVQLDDSQVGQAFAWGARVDTAQAPNRWGIPAEVDDVASTERQCTFTLRGAQQTERFHLTHCRHLGANKLYRDGQLAGIRFAVWAPNARSVELVRGEPVSGYIWPDGRGTTATMAMQRGGDGIWSVDAATNPALADFAAFDHTPYMFRITKDDGSVAYRTDLYSRCQIGTGRVDPEHDPSWSGRRQDVNGGKSCSVVIDPERVVRPFRQMDAQGQPVWPETEWVDADAFWADEFDPNRPLPARLDDLVIYEMHVDGLGLGRNAPRGMLDDAIAMLDYLADLGINCVELMPFSEYEGWANWGYATSHYHAIEYAGGGRDQFKHFVKACHQRGIAVLMDVVYNHYTHDGERAEWAYDSNAPERSIYLWYEGRPSDYPAFNAQVRGTGQEGHGGFIDNMSTGYAPRYWEPIVRKMFVSSAAALVSEFHVDGFRVDQTTSIHSYAVLHADGRRADSARVFGAKFLREWTRTLQLIKPNVFLTAEDHSGWPAVLASNEDSGMGFQAVWYSEYYHHLIGDAQNDASRARLLWNAGFGDNRELRMSWFAGALAAAANSHVIYHESHDEAGNSYYQVNGQDVHSARTIVVAVNGASLSGDTRRYAEARARCMAGITFTAPGVPMFFMGEEVGAWEPYRYDDFLQHRQDFPALRQGVGAGLFRFYQDALRVRRDRPSLRSRNIDILYTHDANRVLAYRRWEGGEEVIVIASLNNGGFDGYRIQNSRIGDAAWREVLNSDAGLYGGWGLVNSDTVRSSGGTLSVRLPSNAVVVLQRQ